MLKFTMKSHCNNAHYNLDSYKVSKTFKKKINHLFIQHRNKTPQRHILHLT